MMQSWHQAIVNDPKAYGLYMTIAAYNTGTWGVVYGFNDNAHYGSGGTGKYGSLTTTLFKDMRVPATPKVVRIASMSLQQNRYLLLGTEVINTPITPDMPILTWKLQTNGQVYNLASGTGAGFVQPVTGKYIIVPSGSIPWNASTVGTSVPFSFV